MIPSDIRTERLRLVAITPERMCADEESPTKLAEILNVIVPPSWPPEHWEPHVFKFLEKQYQAAPHTAAWNRYIILESAPQTLIGTMGAFPKAEDEAELGYSILPPWHGRGLATEAMLVLLEALFRDDKLKSISAQTLPTLAPSIRVLEKCGFRLIGQGDEEGSIRYRLDKP